MAKWLALFYSRERVWIILQSDSRLNLADVTQLCEILQGTLPLNKNKEGKKVRGHRTPVTCSALHVDLLCLRPRLPLFAPPCVEGAAVARVRELGLGQLGQALQRWQHLQSERRAGFQKPHLPQPFGGEGAESCGRNIPESHAQRKQTRFSVNETSEAAVNKRQNQNAWRTDFLFGYRVASLSLQRYLHVTFWWHHLQAKIKTFATSCMLVNATDAKS